MSRTLLQLRLPTRGLSHEIVDVVPRKDQGNRVSKKLLSLTILIFIFGVGVGMGVMRMVAGTPRALEVVEDPLVSIKNDLEALVRAVGDMEIKHLQLYEEVYNEKGGIAGRIDLALKKYDADKTGLIDYALESGGGGIVSVPDTINYYGKVSSIPILGNLGVFNPPETILRPGNQPGQCFAFAGSEGHIRIRLIVPVKVTAITLEHAPFDIAHDIRSAPRDFAIYGLKSDDDEVGSFLGLFQYNLDGYMSLQTFHMPMQHAAQEIERFQLIELHITSNQGHPKYTCVYRVRVHGNE